MQVQITNAGVALLNANQGPIQLGSFKVGSAYNYTPEPTDTNIHGTLLFTGTPTPYGVVNANVVKYSAILDTTVGTWGFGEVGLYAPDGSLFALAVSPELIQKNATVSGAAGNSIRIDIYLSMVGTNYDMWFDVAESNNPFRIATLESVDYLPPSANAVPNCYIVSGASSQQSAFEAYTDRSGMWNFDAYAFANQATVSITGFSSTSVTIALSDYETGFSPEYFGQVIVEFASGQLYSICRYVKTVVVGSTSVTLSFNTPLALTPAVGDQITFFGRQSLSTTIVNLPIATTTNLGGVIVGNGLLVTSQGVLSINTAALPVTSVNGHTGAVDLQASDIQGFAAVAYSGQYSDLIGAPGAYTLPIASTTRLGGVKAPTSGNLQVAGDGTIDLSFPPVKTVNAIPPDVNGNITINLAGAIVGLINPLKIANGTDLNTLLTAGLYFVLVADSPSLLNAPGPSTGRMAAMLEILPGSIAATGGDLIQRWSDGVHIYFRYYTASALSWGPWIPVVTGSSIPIATTTTTGVISVGAGLQITAQGALSTIIQSVNGKSQQYVTLSAADVNAVSTTVVGQAGGVASLAGSATPILNARVPFYQGTVGDWFFAGQWNASTNQLIQANGAGSSYDASTSLTALGTATIDESYGGNNPNFVSPSYASVYQEGAVYQVAVAGTTSIDGITSWAVGDLAVAVNNKWMKIPAAAAGLATTTTAGLMKVGTGLSVTAGLVSVAGVGANSLTNAASGVISYRTNPDGTVEFWGITTLAAGTNTVNVTLPVAAPTGFVGYSTTDTGNSCFAFGIQIVDTSHITVCAPPYWFNPADGTVVARPSAGCAWHLIAH